MDTKTRPNFLQRFLKDPNNLRYSLTMIVPLLVFLISLLSLAVGSNILAPMRTSMIWWWVLALGLFSWATSFIVIWAMTQPINDLVRKAQQYVKLEEMGKERGRLIEVYKLIEQLTEYVRLKTDEGDNTTLLKGIENLDYIIPLGYMSLMVAHEVRNPLNTITGMSELMKQKVTDESQRVYIDTLLEAARKIDVFTHELLDFNNNELTKERFDVQDIIEEAIRHLGRELSHTPCEFVRQGTLFCIADRTKVYQVIHNILRNAAEHEPKGGNIRVSATKDKDCVHVSIYNEHSRIDEKDRESVFKPFYTKKKGGKGLGLFISMRNMKLHGGNITVESGADGTTFVLDLPIGGTGENMEAKASQGKG